LADEIKKLSRLKKISATRWCNSEKGQRAQSRQLRSGGTRGRIKHARRSHIAMLATVRKGHLWRVQITAPNGSVRFFGRFSSEKSAGEWIAAHAPLRVPLNID
jgi:hypothetical protein